MSERFLPQTLVAISAAERAATELALTARINPRLLRARRAAFAQCMKEFRKASEYAVPDECNNRSRD